MINYFYLFCYCCLNFLLFPADITSESIDKNREQGIGNTKQIEYLSSNPTIRFADSLLGSQQAVKNNIDSDDSSNIIDHGNFIIGLWRGFHESEELTVYYGYQFRPDGSFLARHRIYQDKKSIEDITWQGEWQFIDNTLKLKGFDLKDKNQLATLEFKLTDTFKLAYETGSLSASYQQMILNKIGFFSN